MVRGKLLSKIDSIAHKNQLIARKVQGILIDRVYHFFLETLREKETNITEENSVH